MKKHTIWLVDNPTFMDFTPSDRIHKRTVKGEVMAKDLDDAFTKSQNGVTDEWEKFKARSCSVGDVIEVDGKFFFVADMGFDEIEEPTLGYKNS